MAWGAVGHQEGIWPPICSSPHITEVLPAGCRSWGQNMQGLGPLQMMASENIRLGQPGGDSGWLAWGGRLGGGEGPLPGAAGVDGGGWAVTLSSRLYGHARGCRSAGLSCVFSRHGPHRHQPGSWVDQMETGPCGRGGGSRPNAARLWFRPHGQAAPQLSEPVSRPQTGPDTYLLGV